LNPRLQRITDEIEKLRRKLSDYQSRLRDLERQKTELENADIVAMVRGIDIPPDQFAEFIRVFMEGKQNCAVPDLDTQTEYIPKNEQEETTVEEN
jgi:hypothetical protein